MFFILGVRAKSFHYEFFCEFSLITSLALSYFFRIITIPTRLFLISKFKLSSVAFSQILYQNI